MRKKIAALLLAALLCCALPGCAPEVPSPTASQGGAGGFADVAPNASYAQAVVWCRDMGLMSGVSDTAFEPGGTVTRAQVAAALYRAAGQPAAEALPLLDVSPDAWYAPAVFWAAQAGIINGSGGGSFGPDDTVSREQLQVILCRYRGEDPVWTGETAPATRAETAVALMEHLQAGAGVLPPASGGAVERLCVSFNGFTYTAALADNASAAAFVQLLRRNGGAVSIAAQDTGGCEKAGPLDGSIPAPGGHAPAAGDLVYSQGGQLSLCYAPSSQSATLLATLEGDLSQLPADLGGATVSITVSLLG